MRLITVFLLLTTIISCKTKSDTDDKPVDLDFKNHHYDFNDFLRAFTKAAIDKDSISLRLMTNFPLETRGDMDSDPIIKYTEAEFDKIFFDFLTRPTGTNADDFNETQLELLSKTGDVEPSEVQRVGDMEFKKVDGKWKLVFIYYWVTE